MAYQSARHLLGLPIVSNAAPGGGPVGTAESLVINPATIRVEGFLLGHVGNTKNQSYLPLECVVTPTDTALIASFRTAKRPLNAHRVFGLSAWTTQPKFLVGFVYDFYFSWENGTIESFVVHQLIRTWRIPITSIEKITPRALLIHNDTTIKLKITPFPADAA